MFKKCKYYNRVGQMLAEGVDTFIEGRKNVLFFDQQIGANDLRSDTSAYKKLQFSNGLTFVLANGHSSIDQIFDLGDESFYNYFESIRFRNS